jgi:hypothetical protein
VSQTEIDPMKTAISLMLALVTTTALTEPAARAEAAGGRAARARTASQGAADAIAQAEQWDVSLGMDRERQLLLAERTARLAICFLAGEARLGGDKHRRAAPVDHRARDRNRAAIYSAR